ncbi:MAG: hypothetical protein D6734_06830 [Candidatus Schekmanbacteria bacterium]|nr:MAG: hypothetical protein D6734_06830 [Candidatus Schekmanbacteria bacterium]
MKRLIVLLLSVMLVIGLGAVVYAGDYHDGASLVCNQCHTMHASTAHDYGSTSGGYSYTPAEHLLKAGGSTNDLCLSCHDNGVGPDVMGTNDTGSTQRSAGALNKVGGTGPYAEYMGHTIGSTDTAPGGTWSNSNGLSCADCHQHHGADFNVGDVGGNTNIDNYRNLSPVAGGATPTLGVSYAAGTNDLSRDIFEAGVGVRTIAGVNLNEPNSSKSGIAEFCKKCHTNLHGDVGGAEIGGSIANGAFIRHPAAGVDIGDIGGGHSSLDQLNSINNPVRVMDPDGSWTAGAYDGNETPTCLTCHRAHGNGNSFGLIYQAGTSTITEDGDGTNVRDLCNNCHIQGS